VESAFLITRQRPPSLPFLPFLGLIITSSRSRPVPPTNQPLPPSPFPLPSSILPHPPPTRHLFSLDFRLPHLRAILLLFLLCLRDHLFPTSTLNGVTLGLLDDSPILSVLPFNSNIARSLDDRFTQTTNTPRLGSTILKPTAPFFNSISHSPDILFIAGHFSEFYHDVHSPVPEAGISLDLQS
jgi:hypothetical protein